MSGDINRPPSGCTYCGIGAAYHAPQYIPGPGWHSYEPPTESQIRIRMLNRRRERATTKES